jgi:hypothetical protein
MAGRINAGRTATTSVPSFSASPLTQIPAQELLIRRWLLVAVE